ncbi:hypothetical protein Rs2_25638 [Raphanus sativus]|nr:hypothetical protein Rs2_25638 [Raphanus sativus]
MDELDGFFHLLPKGDLKLTMVDSKPSLSLSNEVSVKDDFFIHTPRKTIAELFESKQVERCIVMATIAVIDSDMGWYYLSCKVCAKKVLTVPSDNYDDGDDHDVLAHNYYCPKCKTHSPKLLPRYKLHLVVFDNTLDCKFIVFDNLALQLLHQPCIELTGPVADEIGIEKDNFVYKNDTFKVLNIITNPGMITEYEGTQTPTGSVNDHGYLEEYNGPIPGKRSRPPIVNLEEAFDQYSVTRMACSVRMKKEKIERSG